mmetsp:Transcript_18220/g.47540  ORF Transcript_18220/g.47540 Transcript_18220/m.47540 type:complete len:399 (-) Transcript_18220:317-1513(-)
MCWYGSNKVGRCDWMCGIIGSFAVAAALDSVVAPDSPGAGDPLCWEGVDGSALPAFTALLSPPLTRWRGDGLQQQHRHNWSSTDRSGQPTQPPGSSPPLTDPDHLGLTPTSSGLPCEPLNFADDFHSEIHPEVASLGCIDPAFGGGPSSPPRALSPVLMTVDSSAIDAALQDCGAGNTAVLHDLSFDQIEACLSPTEMPSMSAVPSLPEYFPDAAAQGPLVPSLATEASTALAPSGVSKRAKIGSPAKAKAAARLSKPPTAAKQTVSPARKKVTRRRKRPDSAPDAALDEKLRAIFTIEQMQADTTEWNTAVAAHPLSQSELDRLAVLRRRAKSCLYAEKSRNKQLTQLQQALREVAALKAERSGLLAQVGTLGRRVDQLTHAMELNGGPVPDASSCD